MNQEQKDKILDWAIRLVLLGAAFYFVGRAMQTIF